MATLESLKAALRQKAAESVVQGLSDIQYSIGFEILKQGSSAYEDFITPQLSRILAPLIESRGQISVLEIGPGPKSVLGDLPSHIRRKITEYVAYEPNNIYSWKLKEWVESHPNPPLPCLNSKPKISRISPILDNYNNDKKKHDVILFCHSMYGMKPHHKYITKALSMLRQQSEGSMIVVFHRKGGLDLTGLVCHQTVSFSAGVARVADDDKVLDHFASLIAGISLQDEPEAEEVRMKWRKVCRRLAHCEEEEDSEEYLLFGAPEVMMVFTRHATALAELTAHAPLLEGELMIKTPKNGRHCPTAVIRPTEIQHIQHCVRWALKHKVGLTVIGGGHNAHCVQPSVVSIDMRTFNKVRIIESEKDEQDGASDSTSLILVEAGCNTGNIIQETIAVGLTVPLGSRPSVGAGSWLQGGIGHLARQHGLTCDAIVGAVLVSVDSGRVILAGQVPSQHQPAGAVRLEKEADEAELLWAMKGAGTNFGIVVSVVFKTYADPKYLVRHWDFSQRDGCDVKQKLKEFDSLASSAKELPWNCSADAYLYWDARCLHLGVTMFQPSTATFAHETPPFVSSLGAKHEEKLVDSVELFDTDMYMAKMHGGHGGGKTSSFKRCLFLKGIGAQNITDLFVAAIELRPSPLCYVHLLQGGGTIGDVAADATAFGCRGWEFACVITGVWPSDKDGNKVAQATVQWVYDVAKALLPSSVGVYGTDLGPDPRDAFLAAKAFGRNRPRLANLKSKYDPHNVLAYACPLPKQSMHPKTIILVTGEHGVGKDYCAGVWATVLNDMRNPTSVTARVASISDETKREYAATEGADLDRLLHDRAYKEQHREKLTVFFDNQVRRSPGLPEVHFMNVVFDAEDADVLFITGVREEAPVAILSHLVPNSRLIDIRIQAKDDTSDSTALTYCPSLTFHNGKSGDREVKRFAEEHLIRPFFCDNLQRLAGMVPLVPDFPRQEIEFRHVLGISQQPNGLFLCTGLLRDLFKDDWNKVGAVVCCETGGFIYASALSLMVEVPLALVREAGKLPPPTVSVIKSPSHISAASENVQEKRIEIGQHVVPKSRPVVVFDDVLATSATLCAVLQLLVKAGVCVEDITVIALAEFPVHRGRFLLRERGYGKVKVQSLLVYGGV
ncbi:phosphoribosyl transferase domain protein [Xylaria venustula]|nr:phosphoribosyl transferase domain protein [Xylaria venustula]